MKITVGFIALIILLLTSCTTPGTPHHPQSVQHPGVQKQAPDEDRKDQAENTAPPPEEPPADPVPVQTEADINSGVSAVAIPTATGYALAYNPDTRIIRRLSNYPPAPSERELALRVFPQDAEILIAAYGRLESLTAQRQEKDAAYYHSDAGAVQIRAPGYESLIISPQVDGTITEVKLERSVSPLTLIGEVSTGHQPKSVRFAPDGKSVIVTNLGDFTAAGQFLLEPFSNLRNLQVPEEYRSDSGFVETLILPSRNEIWVSQMILDTIHIFSLDKGVYLSSILLSGKWPKVLLASEDGNRVYASCWDSDTVVEIDVEARREIRVLNTSGTPRGLAFSPDGKELLVTIFSSSGVDRIDLESGRRLLTHDAAPGRVLAMRHIVHDTRRGEYYITAMGAKRVYRLSEDGDWLGWWEVGDKPNTCVMSPDGTRLFVSCRGPNNPDIGYLYKGYEFGKIYIINLVSGEIEDWIWGRDQPTGLDISPDGRFLAFSDFLSNKLELYRID